MYLAISLPVCNQKFGGGRYDGQVWAFTSTFHQNGDGVSKIVGPSMVRYSNYLRMLLEL